MSRVALVAALVGGLLINDALRPRRAAAATPKRALFALVIGYNQSDRKDQATLRYADDDAVQSALLMRQLGAQTVLLTELDADTRKLYPALATAPPTAAALSSALGKLNAAITKARSAGAETTLYLFYTGHGDVAGGEGYVQLRSGRLTRTALLSHLRSIRAHRAHVIIDACKSYFLVFDRGAPAAGRRRRTRGGFLPPDLPLPRNVGFVLSTSSAQNSHEWEAFGAGIFSHEVRSAMRGAADLDGDGSVSYEELTAFVYTANRTVPNRRYRPRFFVRRPRAAKKGAALINLRGARGRRLIFGPKMSRHYFVETRRGVRIADLHPGAGRLTLLAPTVGRLFVREPKRRREYVVDAGAQIELAKLTPRALSSRARGAEHEAFTALFADAYDDRALARFRADNAKATIVLSRPATSLPGWLRPALGGLAVATLALGVTFSVLAAGERGGVDEGTSQAERAARNDRIRRNNIIAISGYALGGAAAAGFLLWTFWPERKVPVRLLARVGPGQAQLRLSF